MEKVNSINEAIVYLQYGLMLTTRNFDQFFFSHDKIYRRFNGSSYSLSIEDFKNLYQDMIFYIYEDNESVIDFEKDEDYYRYYKK